MAPGVLEEVIKRMSIEEVLKLVEEPDARQERPFHGSEVGRATWEDSVWQLSKEVRIIYSISDEWAFEQFILIDPEVGQFKIEPEVFFIMMKLLGRLK